MKRETSRGVDPRLDLECAHDFDVAFPGIFVAARLEAQRAHTS